MCEAVDEETDTINGVTLTYDSSFLCEDAPDSGQYQVTVTVEAEGGDVDLDAIDLRNATPKVRGQSPDVTATSNDIDDGDLTFTVTGTYELVSTDEGDKVNIHLSFLGTAEGEEFTLGFNVHLRGPGAVE